MITPGHGEEDMQTPRIDGDMEGGGTGEEGLEEASVTHSLTFINDLVMITVIVTNSS